MSRTEPAHVHMASVDLPVGFPAPLLAPPTHHAMVTVSAPPMVTALATLLIQLATGVVRAVVDVPKDTSARHVNVNASMVLVMLILQDVRASSIGQGMPVIFPVLASLRGVCVMDMVTARGDSCLHRHVPASTRGTIQPVRNIVQLPCAMRPLQMGSVTSIPAFVSVSSTRVGIGSQAPQVVNATSATQTTMEKTASRNVNVMVMGFVIVVLVCVCASHHPSTASGEISSATRVLMVM